VFAALARHLTDGMHPPAQLCVAQKPVLLTGIVLEAPNQRNCDELFESKIRCIHLRK